MMVALLAVLVAVCGAVGLLGYFTHRLVYLLQTEVECMEAVAARQEKKAERINRAIGAEE
jgi:hypothetical protein